MKIKDLKEAAEKELENLLAENREKLRQIRFDLAGQKIKNFREIRKVKTEIARILTILKQRTNQYGK